MSDTEEVKEFGMVRVIRAAEQVCGNYVSK